jgi:hypothetical protein
VEGMTWWVGVGLGCGFWLWVWVVGLREVVGYE